MQVQDYLVDECDSFGSLEHCIPKLRVELRSPVGNVCKQVEDDAIAITQLRGGDALSAVIVLVDDFDE